MKCCSFREMLLWPKDTHTASDASSGPLHLKSSMGNISKWSHQTSIPSKYNLQMASHRRIGMCFSINILINNTIKLAILHRDKFKHWQKIKRFSNFSLLLFEFVNSIWNAQSMQICMLCATVRALSSSKICNKNLRNRMCDREIF